VDHVKTCVFVGANWTDVGGSWHHFLATKLQLPLVPGTLITSRHSYAPTPAANKIHLAAVQKARPTWTTALYGEPTPFMHVYGNGTSSVRLPWLANVDEAKDSTIHNR
jgi:hypothetical protein